LIWVLVTVVVLFWPGQQSHSLAVKAMSWAADPMSKLPRMPGNFSMEDGEDTEVVAAHDAQEAEYERAYSSSKLERLRLQIRDMEEPFDPSTQQQILVALVVLGSLLVWRLGSRPARG
jgi:hypothetical protein